MNFDHVKDTRIKSVLDGDTSEDALCYALEETLKHAQADQLNEDVSSSVSDQRLSLAIEASEWWNEEGNAFKSLDCLRLTWMI